MKLSTELRQQAALDREYGWEGDYFFKTQAADRIDALEEALRPLAECHLPPPGSIQHVTAVFHADVIRAAKALLREPSNETR